jgi:FeS assembly SUF system protein
VIDMSEEVTPTTPAPAAPSAPVDYLKLHDQVIDAIRQVYDPEIPVNIYDLGLIYGVVVNEDATVDVKMTLTSPACPEAQNLPPMVEMEIKSVEGVKNATVEIVWEPPWDMSQMSEAARLQLGMDI